MTMNMLVACCNAEVTTAKAFSERMNADLFEIVPEKSYSAADLKWTNPLAGCNREKFW